LEVRSAAPVERLDLVLPLPEGLEATRGRNPIGLRVRPGAPRSLELSFRCARWGGYAIGEPLVRARDAFGLFSYEAKAPAVAPLRVYPRPPLLRELLAPLETQVFAGNRVARARGDGIEFADLRPFVAGDRIRRINWRASARRGELWVNDLHPERNADVVLLLDSFAEARNADESTLDRAVRAAFALAAKHLEEPDRAVGRRAAARRRRGGGEIVPALGTPGARVAAAAGALLAAAALAAYPAAAADRLAGALAAGGAVAVLLLALGLATRLPLLVPPALALVGAEYVGVLYLGGDARVLPIAAGGLVLAAELAYWGLEPAPAAGAAA